MNNIVNKTVIFYSGLSIWSMKNKSGAPSFYKTVSLYINKGWNVYMVTFNPENISSDILDKSHVYCMKQKKYYKLISKKIIGKLFLFLRQHDFIRFSKKISKEIISDEEKNKILIYAYEVHGVSPANKIAKKYNLPFVTRFQGTILSEIPDTLVNRVKRYPHFGALKQNSDLVIMTNDGTQGKRTLDRLKAKSKNIKFWINGLDLIEQTNSIKLKNMRGDLGIKPYEKMLLTVSRLEQWKRVDRAIAALASVIKNYPNCKLVIVGDGTRKKELEIYAKKLGVDQKVIFVGSVLHSEVYNYMYSTDIFLSLYDLSNVGNPLLESLALGCCDVVLNTGDTGMFIKNEYNGFVIDKDNLEQLPQVITSIFENNVLHQRIKNNAKEWALNNLYSWKTRMEMEYEAVNKLLK